MKLQLAAIILTVGIGTCLAQTSQETLIRQPLVVIVGAPFTADSVTQTTWIKLDGTPGSETENGRVYRDSQGRTRKEGRLDSTGVWHTLEITDPVAGVVYRIPGIRAGRAVAYRTALPSKQIRSTASELGAVEAKRPNIGVQTIAGFTAVGHQESGSSKATSEQWISPQLMTALMTNRTTDRQMITTTLSNIRLVEPDPQLFQPPQGYIFADTGK